MKSRIFLGYKISRKIIPTINMLKSTIGGDSRYFNWVSGNNLHLTLLFIGLQHNKDIDDINKRITKVLRTVNNFHYQIEGTGVFSKNQRILEKSFKNPGNHKIFKNTPKIVSASN